MLVFITDKNLEVEIPDGSRSIRCKGKNCGKKIFFATMPKGGKLPISQKDDGTWVNHFSDCKNSDKF